jgi:FkbH-like protein
MRFADGIVVRPGQSGELPYSLEILFRPWGQVICVGNAGCVARRWHRRLAPLIPWLGRVSYLLQSAFRPLPSRMQWRITDWIRGAGNRVPRLMNRLAGRLGGRAPDDLLCVVGNPQEAAIQLEISVSGFGDSQDGRSFRHVAELRQGWNVISIPVEEIARVINLKTLFRVCLVPLIDRPALLQFIYVGFAAGGGASGLRTTDHGLQTTDYGLQTTDYGLQTTDYGLQTTDYGLQTTDYGLQTTDYGLQTTDHGLQTENEGTRPPAPGPRTPAPGVRTPDAGRGVKLVVLDLDNTLWHGILIEGPDQQYDLRPGCREALQLLDERGILLSIASKNNREDALSALERLGIRHLFLYPEINWEPKSAGIRRIVKSLNIGMDAVAFVDDSEFERAEVKASLPEVRTWDAPDLVSLPSLEAFNVPVTEESRGRRLLYQQEQSRQEEFQVSSLEYDSFLAGCRTILKLEPLTESTLDRVSELVQRTNQLNFSGIRYVREDLARLLQATDTVAAVLRCEDRFGSYGIVGFSILKRVNDALEMTDLMLSCRIQGKKVEHAYLSYLVAKAESAGLQALVCRYNRTARNAPAGRVFDDLQFQRSAMDGNRNVYRWQCGGPADLHFPVTIDDQLGIGKRL